MACNGISACVHLKAAALDIISEYFCWDSPESIAAAQYAITLLQAFWKEAPVTRIIQDVRDLYPAECFLLFAAFCAANYPEYNPLL